MPETIRKKTMISVEDQSQDVESVEVVSTQLPLEERLRVIESLLFVSDLPLTIAEIARVTQWDKSLIESDLAAYSKACDSRGISLATVSGGYQLQNHPDCLEFIKRLIAGKPRRLTRSNLEVLSIVAYRQPVTRPEVDDIRGVDSGHILKKLIDHELVSILGKKEDVGRPLIYGTTKKFLELFRLDSLKDLPTLKQYAELDDSHQKQVEFQFGNLADLPDPDEASMDKLTELMIDGAEDELATDEMMQELDRALNKTKSVTETFETSQHETAVANPKTSPAAAAPAQKN